MLCVLLLIIAALNFQVQHVSWGMCVTGTRVAHFQTRCFEAKEHGHAQRVHAQRASLGARVAHLQTSNFDTNEQGHTQQICYKRLRLRV